MYKPCIIYSVVAYTFHYIGALGALGIFVLLLHIISCLECNHDIIYYRPSETY